MKILIGNQKRAFCLYIPLALMCNRVSAAMLSHGLRSGSALLPGGVRGTWTITDGSDEEQTEDTLITTAQMYELLKALKQCRNTLKQANLPLLDLEGDDGSRVLITL